MLENLIEQTPVTLISWEVDESERYHRGRAWYVIMGLLGGALLIYAVASANFLFALLILMFVLVVYVTSIKEPKNLRIEISEDGVKVGETLHHFRNIKRYWFVYEPPMIKNLYLDVKSVANPSLSLPLADQNPNQIREILSQYLKEDLAEHEEPFMDFLGRVLKL